MNFAVPSALFWAALAAPIIAFYILKVRLRRVPVSTTLFWRQIFDEKPPRSLWETLRHLLSLLLQLAFLGLLVLALADPTFSWQLLRARRVVLVMDQSASMSARDVEPTRLDAARAAARGIIDGLRFRDELAVVLAGPRPEVALAMSGHISTLKRAVDAIEPTDGPTALLPAVELGRRLIGDHPHGEIIILSDGCSPDVDDVRQAPLVRLQVIGGEASNVGITQFQVRRSFVDPLGYELLAAVQNASDDPVECRLEVDLNGVPVDVLPLRLGPGESWSRTLEKTSLEGGHLTARLTSHDALAADNVAWAVLPAKTRQRVLLVTPGNLFLQKVLEANPLVDVEVAREPPSEWPAGVITVLHRNVPNPLPPGDVWVIDPVESGDLWELGEDLENPIVTEQATSSPLMTHVRLDNVLMPKARQLKFHEPPQVLASAVSGDPLYASVLRKHGRLLALTVNIDEGDLAFRTAFPILVTNALAWFAGETGELRESIATGGVTQLPFPRTALAGTTGLVLRDPQGREYPLLTPENEGQDETVLATVGPLQSTGIWTVVARRGAEATTLAELACNLASAAESDLRSPEADADSTPALASARSWFTRPIWFYLVLVAGALTTMEWAMYQRRVVT